MIHTVKGFGIANKADVDVFLEPSCLFDDPMDFGNSTTFAKTCHIPQIEEQSVKLLQLVNYFGLGEVEWMYDPQSGTYKFLEINTRAWKWHTISNQLGFSFIGAMIDYYNGKESSPVKAQELVGWVERLTDWTVVAKECLKGRMRFSDVCKTYKIRKENIISQSALTALKNEKSVTTDTIAKLCKALNCQPADIMEYVEDTAE